MPETLPRLAFAALTLLAAGTAHADPYAERADVSIHEAGAPDGLQGEAAERGPCTVRAIVERRPGCGGRIGTPDFGNGSSRTFEFEPCDVGRCFEARPMGPSGLMRIEIR